VRGGVQKLEKKTLGRAPVQRICKQTKSILRGGGGWRRRDRGGGGGEVKERRNNFISPRLQEFCKKIQKGVGEAAEPRGGTAKRKDTLIAEV